MLITVIAEATKSLSATSRASGIRALARDHFKNRLSAEVADIAVGDSAMTVKERTHARRDEDLNKQ